MSNSNCDVCKENLNLTYINIENVTDLIKNIKIEAVGHNDLYFCTETDPSAIVTESSVTTCLSAKISCNYSSSEVTDLNMDGLWSVQLEDGTLIEDKTLEELSEILLEYDIVFQTPPSIDLDCNEYLELSSSFSLDYNFDYENDRQWAFYLNGNYVGTTGMQLPNGNRYDYMEDLIYGESNIEADYVGYFTMTNNTTDVISVAFVPTNTKGVLGYPTMQEYNESFSYDSTSGIIKFCLSPYFEPEIGEL